MTEHPMPTTKQLMRQLENGEITIEEAVAVMSTKVYPRAKPTVGDIDTSDISTYDDDSLFWLGNANFKDVISDDEYKMLVDAASVE